MGDEVSAETSTTLICMVCGEVRDERAWEAFVRRYHPAILDWCKARGLRPADADDAAQEVLLRLASALRGFRYDPSRSFRAWLRTVAANVCNDLASRRRESGSGDPAVHRSLLEVEARDDLRRRLDEVFDLELLDEAMLRVRARVSAQNWEAFRLTALQGLAGAEAAARLGIQTAYVFVARKRVQDAIREELRALEGDDG